MTVNVTWIGGTGNFESFNWSVVRIPNTDTGFDDNVLIDGGNSLFNSVVTINTAAKLRDLAISGGDTLTISSGNSATFFATNVSGNQLGAIQNNGTINLAASGGGNTDISLKSGTFTFSGTGTLSLSNNANNRILGNAATDELINASTHTIQGSGQLGVGILKITNQGLILANQSNALNVDPSSSGLANTGTMRATSGATLALQNGAFTNTGGTIKADDNSFVDLTAATITGGTLTSVNAGHFHSLGTANLLSGLTISSGTNIEIGDNGALTLAGSIVNGGTLKLLSGGNATNLKIDPSSATLSGGGAVTSTNYATNRIVAGSGTPTLTNVDNTISGTLQLGVNTLGFVNQAAGVVEANQSNPLTIDPSDLGVVNAGTLRATNHATLQLTDGLFTNFTNSGSLVNGTIEAQDQSYVDVTNATISGGLLNTVDTGRIRSRGGVVLDALALTSGSTLQLMDHTTTTLNGTFTNHGTLEFASGGNPTTLVIPLGGATLAGGGVLSLSNYTNNAITGAKSSATLVNLDNTIRGSGHLDALQFMNQSAGVVQADQSSTLTLDPGSGGVSNAGALRATNHATLQLTDGIFTNFTNSGSLVNGTIEAQDQSYVDISRATVAGGLLKTSGSGKLRSFGDVTLQNVNLTSGSQFVLNDNTSTTFAGTINNEGTFAMASGGNPTNFLVDVAGATLTGGGTVTLTPYANNIITATGTDTSLVNLNNLITGSGQLGADKLQIDNRVNGLIEASFSGSPLVIDPSAAGLSNVGILQAISGATLTLQNGTFTNTGVGKIYAGGSNSVVQTSNATIVGGELQSANGGSFRTAGNTTLSGVTLDANSLWTTPDTTTTTLVGTITNHGTFGLASAGNTTSLTIDAAGVTLLGGGALSLSNTTANVIQGATAKTALVNLDNTISGSGQITVGLDNRASGIVEATQSNPLIIAPVGSVTNIGVLRANGGTLRLSGGTFNNATGQIAASASGSTVEFQNSRVTGGTLSSVAGASLNSIGGTTFADITLAANSTLNVPDATLTTLAGTIDNAGILSVNSGGNMTDLIVDSAGVTLTGGGTVRLSNYTNNRFYGSGTLTNTDNTISGSGQIGNNQLTLVNTGTIEASQSSPLTIDLNNAAPFTNQGTLNAKSGASLVFVDGLTNAGLVTVASGGSFTAQSSFTQSGGFTSVQGTFSAASTTLQSGSILEGNGTINGAVTSGGLISPGVLFDSGSSSSIGTLTFNNTLTLTNTSILLFEIGGTNNYDKLIAPTISLDGYLGVAFASNFQNTVTSKDTFTLVTTNPAGLSGTFASLPNGSFLPTIDGLGSFTVTYTGSSLTLSNFTPVPEPSTYALLGTGLIALLALRRRRR